MNTQHDMRDVQFSHVDDNDNYSWLNTENFSCGVDLQYRGDGPKVFSYCFSQCLLFLYIKRLAMILIFHTAPLISVTLPYQPMGILVCGQNALHLLMASVDSQ